MDGSLECARGAEPGRVDPTQHVHALDQRVRLNPRRKNTSAFDVSAHQRELRTHARWGSLNPARLNLIWGCTVTVGPPFSVKVRFYGYRVLWGCRVAAAPPWSRRNVGSANKRVWRSDARKRAVRDPRHESLSVNEELRPQCVLSGRCTTTQILSSSGGIGTSSRPSVRARNEHATPA